MSLFLKIVSAVKGREIILDNNVTFLYLFQLSLGKALALLRGILLVRQCIFIGRGSNVMAARQLIIGKGVEIGPYCQIDCLSKKGLYIGGGTKIGAYSTLKVSGTLSDLGQKIVLGENVGIGEYAHIGGAADVIVGDNTISGSYLSIHPENHNFEDSSQLIRLQGVTRQGIKVGSNCWIGAKVTLLDGCEVGDGCVIAAGSVVTKKFGDRLLIGGVPAKVLKYLNENTSKYQN